METPQFCGASCHVMKPEFALAISTLRTALGSVRASVQLQIQFAIPGRQVAAGFAGIINAPIVSLTPGVGDDMAAWYIGYQEDSPHPIPLVDRSRMRPELNRQVVPYSGGERRVSGSSYRRSS